MLLNSLPAVMREPFMLIVFIHLFQIKMFFCLGCPVLGRVLTTGASRAPVAVVAAGASRTTVAATAASPPNAMTLVRYNTTAQQVTTANVLCS